MLILVRPPLSSDLEVSMCPDPCETRFCQSRHPASRRSTFGNQALGQCGGILSITPAWKHLKSISEVKVFHSGEALERQFFSSFHQLNWNSSLLYLLYSAVIWSWKQIFWVVHTRNCHLLVGVLWEGSFISMCVQMNEVDTDLQDVCSKSSPNTGCHPRPVLTYYFYFRAPQGKHISWWNNIKQSWRLCQIVHKHGGKLGREAEKGREELMLKHVSEWFWCVCFMLAVLDVVSCC